MYITITALQKFYGTKPLKLDAIVKLVKEPDNKYDTEAIACEMRHFGKNRICCKQHQHSRQRMYERRPGL